LEPYCEFCAIVKGIKHAEIIYEDEIIISFLDIDPVNYGHTLIVPKNHYSNLGDLPDFVATHIMSRSKYVADQLQKALNPDGITIMQNNGCFNDIGHYHMHIVPRYVDDNFKWIYPKLDRSSNRLREFGNLIRKAISV
jgi:diadenosine tetraphosphate (Ap4A) HIT family hydrolase